jgi:hypothetical protein
MHLAVSNLFFISSNIGYSQAHTVGSILCWLVWNKEGIGFGKGFEWEGKGQIECAVLDFVGCLLGDPKQHEFTF